MARRKNRRHPIKKHTPVWRNPIILVTGLVLAGLTGLWLTTPGSQASLSAVLFGTPTPTITPTPLPTSTPTATPSPTATATPPPTAAATSTTAEPPIYGYTIVNTYPHDPAAFTQGLVYVDGTLYEGTGRRGQSSLRRVHLETGEVLQKISLPDNFFGEGIVIWQNKIVQLTWQSRLGFVYDRTTFEQLAQFPYPTEGWGITHDGTRLIMSDGTANLYFWDPDTLAEIGWVEVRYNGEPLPRLNELEYINGEVWANIWQTNFIARIDPDSGQVVGMIDLTGLLSEADRSQPVDVLNGIAYDAATDRLFVTGKLWPKLFEIKLTEKPAQ